MVSCVWYVSKYFGLPTDKVGSRPFMLLREFPKRGVNPVIICANTNHLFHSRDIRNGFELEELDGVQICWLRIKSYQGARSIARIWSWLEFEWRLWRLPKSRLPRPDAVVVSSLSLLTILNGLLLKARFGCRLIFEVRDIWPLTIVEEGGFSPRNPFVMFLQWVERLAYRKSDAIVGTMPNLGQHVSEVTGERKEVACIPMGIHVSQLEMSETLPTDYAARHIPEGKFIVCHAGTIGTTNALGSLIDAARLLKDHADIHFLIVGDGDLKGEFQQLTKDDSNISFAPAVPKACVQSVLQHASLLCFCTLPSKVWSYGQSLNKVVDYMLAGKPIVASYSGFPSMLNEAGCGSFVAAGDAAALATEIKRYRAMNSEQRSKMGKAARTWLVENRSYATLASAYLEVIQPQDLSLPNVKRGQPVEALF